MSLIVVIECEVDSDDQTTEGGHFFVIEHSGLQWVPAPGTWIYANETVAVVVNDDEYAMKVSPAGNQVVYLRASADGTGMKLGKACAQTAFLNTSWLVLTVPEARERHPEFEFNPLAD